VTVYLSTPCAAPECRHSFNWHKAGVCTVTDCQCIAFAAPATAAVDAEEVTR
jgi:hypothetical protein